MILFTHKINKKGQSFKHGQKHLDLHTIFDTLQALEQITDPGNLQLLELIYHVNINPHRLQPPRTARIAGRLPTYHPASIRGSTGFYGLPINYWSVNMDHTYNGWTNRATWLVNVWFNPESKEDVQMARETLEDAIDNLPDFLKDFVDQDINWNELESQFEDETESEGE